MLSTVLAAAVSGWDDSTPDRDFCIAFGCFTGVVATGLVLVGALVAGVRAVSPLGFAVLGTLLVGSIIGGLVVRWWSHGPEQFGGSLRQYVSLAPSLLLLGVGWLYRGEVGLSLLVLCWAFVTLLAGTMVGAMARTRYVRALLQDSTPAVRWQAETPARVKRRRLVFAGVAFVGIFVGIVLSVLFQLGIDGWLSGLGGFVGVAVAPAFRSEQLHAHETGIEIERQVNRGFIPWERFDGYQVSETEIRLEQRWRPDKRCARSNIEDVEHVIEVLDAHIDE